MTTPNVVQAWLELIGTPERAKQLLEEPNWRECPSRQLFGAELSHRLYANPRYTSALDAWDTGMVTRRDILQWAAYVAGGTYHGPRFFYQVVYMNQ
jgi:hypothetical protein